MTDHDQDTTREYQTEGVSRLWNPTARYHIIDLLMVAMAAFWAGVTFIWVVS